MEEEEEEMRDPEERNVGAVFDGTINADFQWNRVKDSLVPDPQHEFYQS